MKCACGYETAMFAEAKNVNIMHMSARLGLCESTIFICPKCGTLKIEVMEPEDDCTREIPRKEPGKKFYSTEQLLKLLEEARCMSREALVDLCKECEALLHMIIDGMPEMEALKRENEFLGLQNTVLREWIRDTVTYRANGTAQQLEICGVPVEEAVDVLFRYRLEKKREGRAK